MNYIGDFALGSTFDVKFSTVATSGAPTTLAGSPVVSAYVDNSVTQLTAGITLTVDFDTDAPVTGLHNVRVVATSGNGYAAGGNYALVVTTGTVAGQTIAGYVIGSFSIEARSGLRPTTAGRTLDVSAGGEAGVDWANVGTPGSTVGLSATTIAALTTNNDKTGYTLSTTGMDNLLTRQITESYAADGAAPTVAQALMMIQQMLGDFSISGTTLTVKKVDGTTTAGTFTLNSATTPTSVTRAT